MTVQFGLRFQNDIPDHAVEKTLSGKRVNVRQFIDDHFKDIEKMVPRDDLVLTFSTDRINPRDNSPDAIMYTVTSTQNDKVIRDGFLPLEEMISYQRVPNQTIRNVLADIYKFFQTDAK